MTAAMRTDSARGSVVKLPGRKLRSTLREVTEYLATMLAGTSHLTPDWSEARWRIAHAVAIIHGISPLLSQRPEWSAGPPAWRAFLLDQRTHSIARHRRVEATLAVVGKVAERERIAFVPLKGAALHALGLYAAGDRPMADVDLLLTPEDRRLMTRALSALGYRLVSANDDVEVLVPPDRSARIHLGEHEDNGVTIELHTAIRRPMPVRQVDITATLWPAAPRSGPNEYPSTAAFMIHLLHHAAVNMQFRILRMVQLHDMALLAPRLSAGDWRHLTTPGDGGSNWWAVPPLILLRRYYPGSVPGEVIAALSSQCPRPLLFAARRQLLSDVSASNLRRPVVPALLWSGSWTETLAAIQGRARNGARSLGLGTSLPPPGELQPWIIPSHRQRALDVLLGRPRPETIMMTSAALAGDFAAMEVQRQPGAA
jgi:hypothetical protein